MRLIITGDKSRYQFLRYIVGKDSISDNEGFHTEQISEKDLIVTAEKECASADTYYSGKIPPNTILFFPAEYGSDISYRSDDRIIFFNEFPYSTDSTIEELDKLIMNGKYGQLEVVLAENSRNGLESDISTGEMALNEAISRYRQKSINVNRYIMGTRPDFLLWSTCQNTRFSQRVFSPLLESVKEYLKVFDSTYELEYELEVGLILNNPIIRKKLIQYEKGMIGKDIWSVFCKRTCDFFFAKNNEVYHFIKELYRNAIKDICIWDYEIDFSLLMKGINNSLAAGFNGLQPLIYNGARENYDEFLNNNHVINTYNQIVMTYFSNKIKEIIKERIIKDINILEELLNGYNH